LFQAVSELVSTQRQNVKVKTTMQKTTVSFIYFYVVKYENSVIEPTHFRQQMFFFRFFVVNEKSKNALKNVLLLFLDNKMFIRCLLHVYFLL